MIVIILCSGYGKRFTDKGYLTPKPLIEIDNKPMINHVINSVNKNIKYEKIFITIQKEINTLFTFKHTINKIQKNIEILELTEYTSGAAESAKIALDLIEVYNPKSPIIIHDCDFSYLSFDLTKLIKFDAGILTFNSNSQNYSYIKKNLNGNVLDIKEKKNISQNAVAGCYYFKSFSVFKDAYNLGKSINKNNLLNEFFMSDLINNLIQLDYEVGCTDVKGYQSYGTPEELAKLNRS